MTFVMRNNLYEILVCVPFGFHCKYWTGKFLRKPIICGYLRRYMYGIDSWVCENAGDATLNRAYLKRILDEIVQSLTRQ